MVKTVLKIDGMACSMCEAHVNDAVRKAFAVKKVTSSHGKGRTEILSDAPLDEAALRDALTAAGYTVMAVRTEPYERRGLSRLRK